MKGAKRINNSGTVFTKDFFNQFSEIMKNEQVEYLKKVDAKDKKGQNESEKKIQMTKAGIEATKSSLNNAVEITNESLWSKSISPENEYIMNAIMEQKSGQFSIQINPDSSQPEFIIPTFNPGGPFLKKSTNAPSMQLVTLDDINKIQEENLVDGKTRAALLSEANILEKKGLDGEDWTDLLDSQVMATSVQKVTDTNIGSLSDDDITGTNTTFRRDFINEWPGWKNIKYSQLYPDAQKADLNMDGVISVDEKDLLTLEDRNVIFDEMQKNKDLFAQHVGEYFKGILKNAWRTGHETFKNKQVTETSDFNPNSYKKV